MKSIRISEYAYDFLTVQSKKERRSRTKMLDYLIDIFNEDENKSRLASGSVPKKGTNR
jgi:hypothetical protein